MKINREGITVMLFLLLLICCTAALVNTLRVSRGMSRLTNEAIALSAGGNPGTESLEQLGDKIDEIARCWGRYEPVVSTYSRHDESERVSSAVRRLRPLFDSGKFGELYLTLHETDDALDHLRTTELPTVANIL